MNLTINNQNGQLVATIQGRLDTVSAPEFEKQMQPLLADDAKDIVMDCTAMEYVASSGLRLFLVLQKSALKRKASLVFTGLSQEVQEVFEMTGFSNILTVR